MFNNDDDKKQIKKPGFNAQAFKHAISMIESSGGKFLDNKNSSAAGKYHFLYNSIKNDPSMKGISKQEFMNRPELQESIMDKALNGELENYPYGENYANKLQERYNSKYNVNELSALVHFLGPNNTRKFLKDPSSFNVPGKTNSTGQEYINKFQGFFDQYNIDNQVAPEVQPAPVSQYGSPPPQRRREDYPTQPIDNTRVAMKKPMIDMSVPENPSQNIYDMDLNGTNAETEANINSFKQGGDLNSQNSVKDLVTIFEGGGSHKENTLGGIPQGTGSNGKPNLVEEGETKWNDYIFSNAYDMEGNYTGQDGSKSNVFEEGGDLNPTDPTDPTDPPTQQQDNTAVKGRNMLDLSNVKIAPNANAKGGLDSLENILADSDKAAKKKANTMSEYDYYNPKVEKDITSGDWKQDFLYNNQFLMDVPVVGGYIKDKIKDMAGKSGGGQYMSSSEIAYQEAKAKEDAGKIAKGEEVEEYTAYTGARNDNDLETPGVNLLDQYFSKEPLLEKAKHKPKDGYYPFLETYSARAKGWEDTIDAKGTNEWDSSPRELVDRQIQILLQDQFYKNKMDETTEGYNADTDTNQSELMWKKFMEDKKTMYSRSNDGSDISDAMNADLGGHSIGIGYDEEAGYPYMSVADAWDFEPRGYTKKWGEEGRSSDESNEETRQLSKIQSSLMHKAGNPYKLYDRFYINPSTGKYMSTAEMEALKLK